MRKSLLLAVITATLTLTATTNAAFTPASDIATASSPSLMDTINLVWAGDNIIQVWGINDNWAGLGSIKVSPDQGVQITNLDLPAGGNSFGHLYTNEVVFGIPEGFEGLWFQFELDTHLSAVYFDIYDDAKSPAFVGTKLVAIPEPASAILGIIGLGGLLLRKRSAA